MARDLQFPRGVRELTFGLSGMSAGGRAGCGRSEGHSEQWRHRGPKPSTPEASSAGAQEPEKKVWQGVACKLRQITGAERASTRTKSSLRQLPPVEPWI